MEPRSADRQSASEASVQDYHAGLNWRQFGCGAETMVMEMLLEMLYSPGSL